MHLTYTNGNFGAIIFNCTQPVLPKTELTPSLFQGYSLYTNIKLLNLLIT